jgi:hypothetical protein
VNDDLKENISVECIKLSQSDREEMQNLKESINCGSQSINPCIMKGNSQLSRNKGKTTESQNPSPKTDQSVKKRNSEVPTAYAQTNKSSNKSPHYYDNSQLERFPTFSGTSLTVFHTPDNDAGGDYNSPPSKKLLMDNQKEIQELRLQVQNLTFMLMQMSSMQAPQMSQVLQSNKENQSPQYCELNDRYRQHMANCQRLNITPQPMVQASPSFFNGQENLPASAEHCNSLKLIECDKKSPVLQTKQGSNIKSDEKSQVKSISVPLAEMKDKKDVTEFKADNKTENVDNGSDNKECSKAEITLTSPSNMSYSMSNATLESMNNVKNKKPEAEAKMEEHGPTLENRPLQSKYTDSNWTFTVPKIVECKEQSSEEEDN